MDFFYYWPDYEQDTADQTKVCYKLHRDTSNILDVQLGDTIWCVASVGRTPKLAVLAAKIVAEKSGKNDASHPDYHKYGPNYFLAARTGTEFYDVQSQSGLDAVLRTLSFPVRAEHVGGSFQGANGFRSLTRSDAVALQAFADGLSAHPVIKVKQKRAVGP